MYLYRKPTINNDNPELMKTVRITVTGKVQGVSFRANTKEVAESLGLKGEVMNKNDFVEIVAQGENGAIDKLIEWCHHGPEKAQVKSVNVEIIAYPVFKKFSIVRI